MLENYVKSSGRYQKRTQIQDMRSLRNPQKSELQLKPESDKSLIGSENEEGMRDNELPEYW
jgi:hypothetical protein